MNIKRPQLASWRYFAYEKEYDVFICLRIITEAKNVVMNKYEKQKQNK